jgi:nucleoside-diphosphate-sugar epimerase
MPWWTGKEAIRRYLRAVNTPAAVLEYTLFQPGLFLDYLASPYQTATHVRPLDTVFDMQNRRAIVVAGHEDAVMTFTSARDLAAVVALAVEHPGRWLEVAGIRGNRVTFAEVVKMGEMIRGKAKFSQLFPSIQFSFHEPIHHYL